MPTNSHRSSRCSSGPARAIRNGLAETKWPGRLETIRRDPLTVIDVGHTPDGVTRALAGLHQTHGGENWLLVVGVSHDKSADEIVALILQHQVVVLAGDAGADELLARLDGVPPVAVETPAQWRQLGLGAQILADLGARRLRVLGTPRKLVGLAGFGIEVVGYEDAGTPL